MPETKQGKKIVAVLDDLFFSSKIIEAAKSLELNLEIAKNTNGLIEKLESQKPSLLIFDLNCKVCNPLETITNLTTSTTLKDVPTVGYLSHVQTELGKQATKAGCDLVLPRSKFSKDLRAILTKFSAERG